MMPYKHFLLVLGILIALCGAGCDTHSDRTQALHTKHRVTVERLLVSLEQYQHQTGTLPGTLNELSVTNLGLADISISDYTYSREGITLHDGTRWLILVKDPIAKGRVIVGRLPKEVSVKASPN